MSKITIVTHDGRFHCDDAMAIAMLNRIPEFANFELVRTRDAGIIDRADVVVDVGGIFDHEKKRYDHHQRGFNEVFGVKHFTRTKLSSAGLVFKCVCVCATVSIFLCMIRV
eukprot:GHVR01107543.1.p1 GENE.GHVR01107543.1~~GHVR01107543.1.p1  ORF type:complete len:111 (+),score=16.77 GHVR01107543.1:49-381(+)